MAWPVVIVTSGGIPVTEVSGELGTPVDVSTTFGTAITLVSSGGLPVKGAVDPLAPAAPSLSWDLNSSDTTPNFTGSLPDSPPGLAAAVNDMLRVQSSANSGASWDAYLTHTVDAGDLSSAPTVSGATPLSSGTYLFRARLERTVHNSPWSANESATVAAAALPSAPVLTWPTAATVMNPSLTAALPHGAGDATDAASGDVVVYQFSVNAGSTWTRYAAPTLGAIDIILTSVTASGPIQAAGSTQARCRIERGATVSSWSNVVTKTLAPADGEFGTNGSVDSFSAGSQVNSEGLTSFDTGYWSIPANTIPAKTVSAVSSGIHSVEFSTYVSDTTTAVGAGANTFFYILPTLGTISSANAIAVIGVIRDSGQGASSTKFLLQYRDSGGSFLQILPALWGRGLRIKIRITFDFSTHKFDIYVNEVLYMRNLTWPNAAAADFARVAVNNGASAPTVLVDSVLVTYNWALASETLLVSDTFTANAGEIETTTPSTELRALYGQPWKIPDDTTTYGAFTRGASGLVPDAAKQCLAMVRCGAEGTFEVDWTAASSSVIYMGIMVRVWAGLGSNSYLVFRYDSSAAAGHQLNFAQGGTELAASAGTAGGVTYSASAAYTLAIVLRGAFAWCYVNSQLQFGGPVNIGTLGARGQLSEEHAGPYINTNTGSTTNRCTAFRWTGRIASESFFANIGKYTARHEPGSVRELYHSDLTLSTRNLFWSKGQQLGHISEADPCNYALAHVRQINAPNVSVTRQRSIAIKENDIYAQSETYATFLRRGPWYSERIRYFGTGGSINFTPDMDLRPDMWSSSFRTCDSTGAGTSRTQSFGGFGNVETSTGLPKAYQVITSGSGNKLRLTATMRSNLNVSGLSTDVSSKWEGNGDPFSVAFNIGGAVMTYGTDYEIARGYIYETGSLSLDDTTLTDWRDDIKTPPVPTFTVGSLNTAVAGDIDTDGFNERHGWHEITCSSGLASFTYVKGTPNKRYGAAFRLSGWTVGSTRTVTIAGVLGVENTDYVLDDIGDGTAILQLLTNRTADTTIAIA